MGSGIDIDDGQWHFVVGNYSATATATKKILYIDGEEAQSAADPHAGQALGRNLRFGYLGVGSDATTFQGTVNPAQYWDGYIDEFVIFHRALKPEEVQEMYKVGKPREKR